MPNLFCCHYECYVGTNIIYCVIILSVSLHFSWLSCNCYKEIYVGKVCFKLKTWIFFPFYVMHGMHVMSTSYVQNGFLNYHCSIGTCTKCCVILTSKYNPFFCVFKEWCSYEPKDYRGVVKDLLKNKKHPKKDRRI